MVRRWTPLLLAAALLLTAEDCPEEDAEVGGEEYDPFADGPDGPEDGDLDATAADCAPVDWISCEQTVTGDTSDVNSGTTDVIDSWPMAVGNYSGPEIAWAFRAPRTGEFRFRLVDPDPMSVDHDLFVIAGDDACLADRALARGFNYVTFEATAGENVYLALDGFDGDAGPFEAKLECDEFEDVTVEPGDDDDDDEAGACCLWLDLDNTLNTIGSWGYPFNPVPAAEFCSVLGSLGDSVISTPLTARAGCLPAFQPGESQCAGVLEQTVSVRCSSGDEAAGHKEEYMRSQDDVCSRHVLIDDNEAAAGITGGDPPIVYVEPIDWNWDGTLANILAALDGC